MTEGEVVIVKLASGADLIGFMGLVDEEEGTFAVVRPHMMQMVHTPQGAGINMVPVHVFSDDPQSEEHEIDIHALQYLTAYSPTQHIQDQFKQMLSGIVIPRSSIVMGG